MLPMSNTKLPPGDSLDRTPAITAGSIQYFCPTSLMVGWYLRRYGLSTSASRSEARTPAANTERRTWMMVIQA
ncbi:rCG22504 [Rattus norvegicus]|uniref:RCG22504 n=1 Tax=Rattus norvegicus TaxID=10116 RepID=A6INJ0_RAT|nr:rCG22504 [Rattus norvegicus]